MIVSKSFNNIQNYFGWCITRSCQQNYIQRYMQRYVQVMENMNYQRYTNFDDWRMIGYAEKVLQNNLQLIIAKEKGDEYDWHIWPLIINSILGTTSPYYIIELCISGTTNTKYTHTLSLETIAAKKSGRLKRLTLFCCNIL